MSDGGGYQKKMIIIRKLNLFNINSKIIFLNKSIHHNIFKLKILKFPASAILIVYKL